MDAELAHHIADVALGRALADEDPVSDLGVGEAAGEQLDDFPLT
jgi:hypothetical protein